MVYRIVRKVVKIGPKFLEMILRAMLQTSLRCSSFSVTKATIFRTICHCQDWKAEQRKQLSKDVIKSRFPFDVAGISIEFPSYYYIEQSLVVSCPVVLGSV